MSFQVRILTGLILLITSGAVLWYGSPARLLHGDARFAYAFLLLFAIGFMLFSMGILGTEGAYPALLSGFVLYFIVGGLITVFIYLTGSGLAQYTLSEAGNPLFWREAARLSALWPIYIVQTLGIFEWDMAKI